MILLLEEKLKLLYEYLDKNIAKRFIRKFSLIVKILIFFISKKGDKKDRFVINYYGLNKIIIKDTYLLSLANEL
jgi:hypothetical protein